MNSSTFKHEGWLYWLAFLIAIGFRLIQLGASPLTDSEAALALQALNIARGDSPLLSPQPAYILLTSILFAIMESTNFLARFLPALAGSALVFVPYFFREKIKSRPALILAFLFAFDPALVALSRQANGTILAATFLLFAWAMWNHKQLIPAGIFTGFALLSGPSLWAGLLTLGLTYLFIQRIKPRVTESQSPIEDPKLVLNQVEASEIENRESPIPNLQSPVSGLQSPTSTDQPQFSNPPILQSPISSPQSPIIAKHPRGTNYQLLASALATLLLCGTLFFIAPNGLSAFLSSIPAYFAGWVTPTITTPARILFTFLAYEPLGIFLAILACVRGFRTKSGRFIRPMMWLGIALLLAIFDRQPAELIWAVLPLLTLSALELSRALDVQREELVESGVITAAILILLAYTWFKLAGIALNPFNQAPTTVPVLGEVSNPRYLVLFGSLAIVIISIALIAFGWSARIARLGTTWSFAIFLSIYAMGAAWAASGQRNLNGIELWTSDSKPLQADLLTASVDDISEFSLGHTQSQPVTVFGIISPALEWALRNHPVTVVSALDPQLAPPIVLTPLMDDLGLPSAYRGQDFTWRQRPQWETIQTPDWIKWLVFHELPMENETIILWARNDLFPDAREDTQP
jgi:hypothetical protein